MHHVVGFDITVYYTTPFYFMLMGFAATVGGSKTAKVADTVNLTSSTETEAA